VARLSLKRAVVVFAVVWAVAIAARWTSLPQSSALGDALGPWLVGARGPWSTRPHAAPYGWLLAVPHAVILRAAGDLWGAFAAIRVVDALVAPLTALAAFRSTRSTFRALAAGLLLALDPGLIDTATSGAEAYQAPVAIALLLVATTAHTARWGPWVAVGAFAWALMCHPLSVVAAPLLWWVRWRRAPLAVVAGTAVLLPHLLYLGSAAGDAAADSASLPVVAFEAWVDQAGPLVWVFAVSALGVVRQRRLWLSLGTGLFLLLLAGTQLGYLRDHHVRLLSPPLALGLARLPSPLSLGALALTASWPDDPRDRPGGARRPGSLGLLHQMGSELMAVRDPTRPLMIDGVTDHGVLAVEPGGLLLDLHLRGVPPDLLDVRDDTDVVVILSGKRRHEWLSSPGPFQLKRVAAQDTWAVFVGTPQQLVQWSESDCAERAQAGRPPPRVGGAWDGLAIWHPERGAKAVDWWACSRQ